MSIITASKLPYCPGCSYHLVTRFMDKALEKLGFSPLEIILVSDIGCCGLIDSTLGVNTIHGLHGRSNALGLGVAACAENKKVVVFQGDGGITIGMQHMLEAARLNVNMTVIVVNNFVYGMTGGQPSGLTPENFENRLRPQNFTFPPYDIVRLAYEAGAAYSARLYALGDFSAQLAEAFAVNGFSLVEIIGCCVSYGAANVSVLKQFEKETLVLKRERQPLQIDFSQKKSLLQDAQTAQYKAELRGELNFLFAGSAGEAVQTAGEIFAQAAVLSGLYSTKKSEYPITVGTGFSVAEVKISEKEIIFTGVNKPDVVFLTSADGLQKIIGLVEKKNFGQLIIDSSLPLPEGGNVISRPFRQLGGAKSASLLAVAWWLKQNAILDFEALKQVCLQAKHAEKLLETLEKAAQI